MIERLSREARVGILTSLVASIIFLIFLNPFLAILGNITMKIIEVLSLSYQDRLFSEIAVGDPNFAFNMIAFLCGASAFSVIFAMIRKTFRHLQSLKIELFSSHESIEPEIERKTNKSSRKLKWRIYASSIVILIGEMLIIGDGYIRINISSSFNQYVRILTPHITLHEKDEIIAQFASMKSRSDYYSLLKRMNSIAIQQSIHLPENKLYPIP